MQRTLSAISAAVLGLAMLLGSAVSSSAAPVSPQAVQVNSSIEQVQYRDDYRPHYRSWQHRRDDWRRPYYRSHRDWRRTHWDNRRYYDRRWNGHRYWRPDPYLGGSGRSHQ